MRVPVAHVALKDWPEHWLQPHPTIELIHNFADMLVSQSRGVAIWYTFTLRRVKFRG